MISPARMNQGFPGFPMRGNTPAFPDFRRMAKIEKAVLGVRSVIVDIADNWGASFMGIRSIWFYKNTNLIELLNDDISAYATTYYGSNYLPSFTFRTDLPRSGTAVGSQWYSSVGMSSNQRLIVVADSPIVFDEIRLNNSHVSYSLTNYGVKNIKIYVSSEIITSTVYNEAIPNSTCIFDGQVREWVGGGDFDDQVLDIDL
jgi:hypothetical protein